MIFTSKVRISTIRTSEVAQICTTSCFPYRVYWKCVLFYTHNFICN